MKKEKKRTSISSIGEFGLIERFKKKITHNNPQTIQGVGDDSAVIKAPKNQAKMNINKHFYSFNFDKNPRSSKNINYLIFLDNSSFI